VAEDLSKGGRYFWPDTVDSAIIYVTYVIFKAIVY
jgi:hypothetical protein